MTTILMSVQVLLVARLVARKYSVQPTYSARFCTIKAAKFELGILSENLDKITTLK
jgi:hypothetical protein